MRIEIVTVLLAIFAIQSILSISIDLSDPEVQALNQFNDCVENAEDEDTRIESFKTIIDFMKKCGIKFGEQPYIKPEISVVSYGLGTKTEIDHPGGDLTSLMVHRLTMCKIGDPKFFISGEISDKYLGENTVFFDYESWEVLVEDCGNEDTYLEDIQLIQGLYPDVNFEIKYDWKIEFEKKWKLNKLIEKKNKKS